MMTRRRFLGAAGSMAGWQVMSGLARGGPAANARLAIGVIGSGGRGKAHLKEYFSDAGARVVAVCDVRADQAQAAKALVDKQYGDTSCRAFGDFRELLARGEVDAVSIAVPDHWHALVALAAIRAGKHVYLEKPMAYTIPEGRAIVEAVRRKGVVMQNGTQQRSMANYRLACELVRNGRIGRLHTVRVGSPFGFRGGSTAPAPVPEELNYDMWLGPAPVVPYTAGRCDGGSGAGWYHIRDYSGGWVTAWGAHDIDSAHWGMGADATGPVEIDAWGIFPEVGVYDTAWQWRAECTYADGVKVIYATEQENRHGVRFEGTDGWVFVRRGFTDAHPKTLLYETIRPGEIRLEESDNNFACFLDAIRTGRAVTAPPEGAHRSTSVCHLMNIAMRLGRKLRWDPQAEKFVGDDTADRMLGRAMREPWSLI